MIVVSWLLFKGFFLSSPRRNQAEPTPVVRAQCMEAKLSTLAPPPIPAQTGAPVHEPQQPEVGGIPETSVQAPAQGGGTLPLLEEAYLAARTAWQTTHPSLTVLGVVIVVALVAMFFSFQNQRDRCNSHELFYSMQLAALEAKLSSLSRDVSGLDSKLSRLSRDVSYLDSELSSLDSKLSRLRSDVSDLERKVRRLE